MKKLGHKLKNSILSVLKELKDFRTFILFFIVLIVFSSHIWAPYVIAYIFGLGTTIGKVMFTIGTSCLAFWVGPCTPFFPICIALTLGLKKLLYRGKHA